MRKLFLVLVHCILTLYGLGHTTVILVPENYPTIQEAIDIATFGDTVAVRANQTYSPSTNGEIFPLIMKDGIFLIARSLDPSRTIVDAQGTGRVFTCLNLDSLSVIKNFTIQSGIAYPENGGGIYCENSNLMIRNNIIRFNSANYGYGGGVYVTDTSRVTLEENIIRNNSAYYGYGGGIYCVSDTISLSSLTISTCSIDSNVADYGGGIYVLGGDPVIENCTLLDNDAIIDGGGMYFDQSAPEISHTTCEGAGGRGMYFFSSSGRVSNCRIKKSTSSGIFLSYSDAEFESTIVDNNNGDGIYCWSGSTPSFSNVLILDNGSRGLRLYNSDATVTKSTIMGNYSDGIYIYNYSTSVIDSCNIRINFNGVTKNTSNSYAMSITNSKIAENSNDGGISVYGGDQSTIIERNKILNNYSSSDGGGIYCDGADILIRKNLITGNSTYNNGGGVFLDYNSDPMIGGSMYLQNDIQGNEGLEIYSENSSVVIAEYNWWGTTDLDSLTEKFYGNIDYIPFAPDPLYDFYVSLEPDTIFIARGDSVRYRATIVNTSDETKTYTVWTHITLPSGDPYGGNPLLGPVNLTLAAKDTISMNYAHKIPRVAPTGIYQYTATIADSYPPGNIIDLDWFHFVVE